MQVACILPAKQVHSLNLHFYILLTHNLHPHKYFLSNMINSLICTCCGTIKVIFWKHFQVSLNVINTSTTIIIQVQKWHVHEAVTVGMLIEHFPEIMLVEGQLIWIKGSLKSHISLVSHLIMNALC